MLPFSLSSALMFVWNSYFIWSGWADSSHQTTQNLYIARMSSPTQISGARVLLHEPTPSWQQSGGQAINEGPEILVNNGRTFLVYCEQLCLLHSVFTLLTYDA